MIIPIKDKCSGTAPAKTGEYAIVSNTAVEYGAVVKISANKVVLALTGETGDILGVAAESHAGTASAVNQRENGLKILVYDNPCQAFSAKAPVLTAGVGSDTTSLICDIAVTGTDNALVGGFIRLKSKVALSANTDPIGTVYTISAFDASAADITVNEAGGAITAGDTFELLPPIGYTEFALGAHATDFVVSTIGQSALKVTGYTLDADGNMTGIEIYPDKHLYR